MAVVVPASKVTEPLVAEPVKPAMEATLIFQQILVLEVLTSI